MDKILVPVDFSVPSSWGFYYAYDLAASIGAELVVLHMYMPYTEPVYSVTKLQAMAAERYDDILAHLKAATQRPVGSNESDVKVSYVIDYHEKSDIAAYVNDKDHKVDLVVMGTHGAGNAVGKVWGSNTSNVIKNANCPVLAVPVGAEFGATQNMAYATDFDSKDIETIAQLAVVAAATNSKLHCVHINLFSNKAVTEADKNFEETLKEKFAGLDVSFTSWSANNVEDGLEIFCRVNNIDILAMLTHDKSTWNKLFGEKSVTKSMALRSNLPLLAFHE